MCYTNNISPQALLLRLNADLLANGFYSLAIFSLREFFNILKANTIAIMEERDMKPTKDRFIEKQEELYDKVFRRCYSKTSSKEVAKDLTQDVFTRVWDYICQGNEIRYLNSFVYRVTSNRIKDWYKKKKTIPMAKLGDFDEMSISDNSHESITYGAEMRHVWRRLNELGDHYAEVIRMRIFEGMSPQEIAKSLGERTNTVSVRIHRGLKRFRELLSESPEGYDSSKMNSVISNN